MNLRHLETFKAVYEERSFTRAAERLEVSQPTVSANIRTLEEELGTPLFDRLGRTIQPTRAGDLLQRHARRLLELFRVMEDDVDQYLHGVRGRLELGASTIPGEYWLPHLIGPFHELHPEISVSVEIHDTEEILERVRDGRLEAGIVGARRPDPKLEFQRLVDDRLLLLVAPSSRWAEGDDVGIEELLSLPFVAREPGSGTRLMFERRLEEAGGSPRDLRIVAELGSTTAVKEAVRAGLGVSIISQRAVATELESGVLAALPLRGVAPIERAFYSAASAERVRSPLVRTFLEFLRDEARGRPWPSPRAERA